MFVKDTRSENLLTSFGVSWAYSNDVVIDDLVRDWDRMNSGRKVPVNDEAVTEYAFRMEEGEQAPAVILLTTPSGYRVLDGIQRLTALILMGATRFSAYTVETDSETVAECIRVLANRKLSGYREDPQWEMRQAIMVLVDGRGCSVDEVARWLGVKKERIEKEKRFLDWSFAIRRIGGPQQMKRGVVEVVAEHARLHDFEVARKPIAEFLADIQRGKFTNGDSAPHIEAFFDGIPRKGKSTAFKAYAQRLEAFRKDPEVKTRLEGRSVNRHSPETRIRQSLKAALTVVKQVVKDGGEIHYVEEFYQLCNQIHKELEHLNKTSTTRA